MNANELKIIVQEKYGKIAEQSKQQNENSCCGATGCCSTIDYAVFSENYETLEGYTPDADLGLGCGIPTKFAGIQLGHYVLDLGSGAGNDCFVARAIVGNNGKVTGLDFTDNMLEKARIQAQKLGFTNVKFVKGDIEDMPLPSNMYDVVVSNCVLNLVPDKSKAFSHIMRVLKPNGHFCLSDVVLKGNLPEKLQKNAEMYAGCVSGAIDMQEYIGIIEKQGFKQITIHKQKKIEIPHDILKEYLTTNEIEELQSKEIGIYSITISAYKS